MKRWILLLVLLPSCNGCAFYDDVLYEEPVYTQMQPASNSSECRPAMSTYRKASSRRANV